MIVFFTTFATSVVSFAILISAFVLFTYVAVRRTIRKVNYVLAFLGRLQQHDLNRHIRFQSFEIGALRTEQQLHRCRLLWLQEKTSSRSQLSQPASMYSSQLWAASSNTI